MRPSPSLAVTRTGAAAVVGGLLIALSGGTAATAALPPSDVPSPTVSHTLLSTMQLPRRSSLIQGYLDADPSLAAQAASANATVRAEMRERLVHDSGR